MRQLLVLSLVSLILSIPAAAQGTTVGGFMFSNTTWTVSGSPYTVTISITILNGATLIIDPGVVVRFNNSLGITVGEATTQVAGTLVARGTSALPILFTSAAPGSLPGPCSGSPGTNGSWNSIFFTDYAIDATFDPAGNYVAGSILEYCTIDRGGLTDAAVRIEKSSPFVCACTIQNNCPFGGLRADLQAGSSGPTPVLQVSKCTIRQNRRQNGGGGMSVEYGTAHVSGCTIANNTGGLLGGGIYFSAFINSIVQDCLIHGNIASGNGGGCHLVGGNGVAMARNIIVGNSAQYGGGAFLYSVLNHSLTDNTIATNTAAAEGGGVFHFGYGPALLSRNRISGNVAGTKGGGMYGNLGGSISLTSCTIADNRAANGGGMYINDILGPGVPTLAGNMQNGGFNSFVGNTALSHGDAVYFGVPCNSTCTSLDASYVCWGGLDPLPPSNPNLIWDHSDDSSLRQVLPFNAVRCDPFGDLGGGVAGSNGLPVLSGTGALSVGTQATLQLSNAAPSASAFLVIGGSAQYLPFMQALVFPDLQGIILPLATNAAGQVALSFGMPAGIPAGTRLWSQFVVADAAAGNGLASFSNGLLAVTP